eukprot:13892261-Alexandrium_andersonii.AAC.1
MARGLALLPHLLAVLHAGGPETRFRGGRRRADFRPLLSQALEQVRFCVLVPSRGRGEGVKKRRAGQRRCQWGRPPPRG